ncbi:alpha/beta fold hydrolase [bacterium]|nr:alpha/beta fold hydrolase [bacterium]
MNSSDLRAPFFYQAGHIGCVLIHGFTGTPFAVRGLGKSLYSRDITVYAPCLPGHGTRPKDLIGISYKEWIDAGRNAVRKVQNHCDIVFIIGLSMGGTIALYLASEMSVQGCVSIASPIDGSYFQKPGYAIVKRFFRYWPKWHSLKKPHHPELGYRWYPLPAVDMFLELLKTARQRLPRVSCPLLLIHSESDPEVPLSHMNQISNAVCSEVKQSIVLKIKKHAVTLGREKEKIFDQIGLFVERTGRISETTLSDCPTCA